MLENPNRIQHLLFAIGICLKQLQFDKTLIKVAFILPKLDI